MHRLFGSGKPSGGKKEDDQEKVDPTPTLSDTARSIDGRVNELDAKIRAIDVELLRYREQLKKAGPSMRSGIEKRALTTMKRKKMYQAQRDSMINQVFTIEQTQFAIDKVQDTQNAISTMKMATEVLRNETKKIDLDELEDMQDDLFDLFEEQEILQETLGRSYATPDDIDEDDLAAELAGLEEVFEGIQVEEQPTTSSSISADPNTVFTGGVEVPTSSIAPPRRGGEQSII